MDHPSPAFRCLPLYAPTTRSVRLEPYSQPASVRDEHGEVHELCSVHQIEHRVVQDVSSGGAIFLGTPFVGAVADAVPGADEDHAHRKETRKLHPIMAGA